MMSVSLSQPAFLLFKLLGILFFDMKPGTINLLRAGQTNTIGFTNGFSKLAFVVRYGHKFRDIYIYTYVMYLSIYIYIYEMAYVAFDL